MKDLADEMKQRADAAGPRRRPAGLPVHPRPPEIQQAALRGGFRLLGRRRRRRRPIPALLLNNLICEGTRLGFHVIATCDTYNNVNRFLSRKAFSEFEMRVLFQMSANDSASLIDSPKASLLGLHRALFFNAQEGYLETFRPYALPGRDWIDSAARNLARLLPRKSP